MRQTLLQRFRKKAIWVVAILALIATGCGLRWWYSPRPLKLIAEVPAQSNVVFSSTAGLLFIEDAAASTHSGPFTLNLPQPSVTLALYDWQGHRRWRVILPKPFSSARKPFSRYDFYWCEWKGYSYGLSPDGRVLAAVAMQGSHARVVTWEDGKLVGDISIPIAIHGPLTSDYPLDVTVENNGRVWLFTPQSRIVSLLLIQGNKLVASGRHTIGFRVVDLDETPLGNPEYLWTLDAKTGVLVGWLMPNGLYVYVDDVLQFEYTTLKVEGERIYTKPIYITRAPVPCQTSGGTVLGYNGEVYDKTGRRHNATSWKRESYFNAEPSSVNTVFSSTAQMRSAVTHCWIIQKKGLLHRAFCPATGESWSLPQLQKGYQEYTDVYNESGLTSHAEDMVSTDGRFVLRCVAGRLPIQEYPLISWLRDRLHRHSRPATLELYERPGRLRARLSGTISEEMMKVPEDRLYWFNLPGSKGREMLIENAFISPDGHRLAIMGCQRDTTEQSFFGPSLIRFYRW